MTAGPRSALVRWGWGVALALPALALFFAWKGLEGWASTASGLLLLAYAICMIVAGVRAEAWTWWTTDDTDPGDHGADRDPTRQEPPRSG